MRRCIPVAWGGGECLGFMDSLRSAPGSHQVRSGVRPPQLEGQFSHMTSSTAGHGFSHP